MHKQTGNWISTTVGKYFTSNEIVPIAREESKDYGCQLIVEDHFLSAPCSLPERHGRFRWFLLDGLLLISNSKTEGMFVLLIAPLNDISLPKLH